MSCILIQEEKANLLEWIAALEVARDTGDYKTAASLLRQLGKGNGLVSAIAARKARSISRQKDEAKKREILDYQIKWMKACAKQIYYIGQTLDYTSMPLGTSAPITGEEIRKCPKCGRNAIVYDEFEHLAIHVEKIDSWITSVMVDKCKGW